MALLYSEPVTGGSEGLRAARRAGEEYLLRRRLLHTRSTGEFVGPWVTWFAYPSWFDVPPREPSKWLTFYGTRVLDWWDA